MKKHLLYIFLALFFGALFYYTQYPDRIIGINHYDEGIMLFASQNILDGKLPYRDFYFMYPPGFYVFLAGIFKQFGASLWIGRVTMLIIQAAIVSAAFLYSVYSGSLLFGLITAFMLINFRTDFSIGSMLFIILGYFSTYLFFVTRKNKFLLLSGILLGLSTFFRIDSGFYSFVSVSITLLILSLLIHDNKARIYKRLLQFLYIFKYYLAGILLGSIPIIITFISLGIKDTYINLIVNPKQLSAGLHLPFPSLFPDIDIYLQNINIIPFQKYFSLIVSAWPFYFLFFVSITGIILLSLNIDRVRKNVPFFMNSLLLSITILVFTPYMFNRSDIEHTWAINLFAFLALPYIFWSIYGLLKNKIAVIVCFSIITLIGWGLWDNYYLTIFIHLIPQLLLFGVIFYFVTSEMTAFLNVKSFIVILLFLLNLLLLNRLKINQKDNTNLIKMNLPRTGTIYVQKQEQSYMELISYLNTVLQKKEPILSASMRHDKVFINDDILYFLTDTTSAIYYWPYAPGIQTSIDVQLKMKDELSTIKPRYIIIWLRASESQEPNLSSQSSGVTLLDEYIKSNYKPTKQFGDYVILESNTENKIPKS